MTGNEFSMSFDIYYNNITSNQAPGLNEHEKSVFLTKAQDELIKNYFLPQSNPKQAGYDGNQKRQMDFSLLMRTHGSGQVTAPAQNKYSMGTSDVAHDDYDPSFMYTQSYDPRGALYTMPGDLFIPINESLRFVIRKLGATAGTYEYTTVFQRQVIPLSYEEYTRLMSKPYKEPLKNQAWRLLVDNTINSVYVDSEGHHINGKLAEIIAGHNDVKWSKASVIGETRLIQYIVRYIRRPKPIIIAPLDSYGVSIDGHDGHYNTSEDYDTAYNYSDDHTEILDPCELDESLHEEILQRAVELAKVAWTANGQDNAQMVIQAGQRSE